MIQRKVNLSPGGGGHSSFSAVPEVSVWSHISSLSVSFSHVGLATANVYCAFPWGPALSQELALYRVLSSSQQPEEAGTTVVPIWQMRKWRKSWACWGCHDWHCGMTLATGEF